MTSVMSVMITVETLLTMNMFATITVLGAESIGIETNQI